MVSHLAVIISSDHSSRHVYSVHLNTIHPCEVMGSNVKQAGRSGSTPDKGITGDAERRTCRDRHRRKIRNRKVLSMHYFATTRANERALKTKELFSMIKEKVVEK